MTTGLPPHIAFSRKVAPDIRFNLSDSCAASMTLDELSRTGGWIDQGMSLEYASLQGDPALRQEIAGLHNDLNYPGVDGRYRPEQIVTFCGAQEALRAVYSAVLRHGDEVIVASPCYPSLACMCAEYGAVLKPLCLNLQPNGTEKRWRFDLEQLQSLISPRTRLLVLNSPHNPTGFALNQRERTAIFEMARDADCYLLMDDVSQGINPNGLDLGHRIIEYDKAVVVSVMSKSFGLGGVRIGWAITTNEVLRESLMAHKAGNSICTSRLDEILALTALRNREQILNCNTELVGSNIRMFSKFIANFSDKISWVPPDAGLLASAEIQCSEPIEDWCLSLARQTGVLLLPLSLFGLKGNFVRIGLGQRNFEAGLTALAGLLR
jgi:aspartate/methionine/tyrosine aminotransferase